MILVLEMKLLVTGGCGFIGSNFIFHILNKYKDYEVVNLDKLTYAGNKETLKPFENNSRYKFVQGDVCDQKLVNLLTDEVDSIVHFAAETHVDRSIINSGDFARTNFTGTNTLLQAAERGRKRFHLISTNETFGSLKENERRFDETTTPNPQSPYAATKKGADFLANTYFHTFGLPVTISNCSNNYGPYQFPEKMIPLFITNLIIGKKVPLYGDGRNIRDWIYVQDHVEAIDLMLHNGKIGESYCVGGDSEFRNIDVARMILKHFNKGDDMIEFVKDRKGHDWRYAVDSSKIKKELGWSPKKTFEKGLEETVKWYIENELWWRKLKVDVIDRITEKE